MYGEGISRTGEVIDVASNLGIVDKSGAWFSYKGEKIGQGKENVKVLLKTNKKLAEEIEKQIREFYNINDTNNKDK